MPTAPSDTLPLFAEIIPIAPLEGTLTYRIPENYQSSIEVGKRVIIPLRKRRVVGVVFALSDQSDRECREIEEVLDETPFLNQAILHLLKWCSDYYLAPLGEILRLALPAALRKVSTSKKRSPKTSLKDQNLIFPLPALSSAQKQIFDDMQKVFSSQQKKFSVHLLHGITGSGKTRIYFELLKVILEQNGQALCLVPEISLTPQAFARYSAYFGQKVAVFHSNLAATVREQVFKDCASGKIRILLGTRSALFAPFQHLKLLVIDEEQDRSYKQQGRVSYHARDLAIMRASFEDCPVILGSATPSVETYFKAKQKKFFYYFLNERFSDAKLPEIEIVPLDAESRSKKHSLLSKRLIDEIQTNLDRGEQTFIYLNRRGFAHCLVCEDCGWSPRCPHCEIALTTHRKPPRLLCHYCDQTQRIPPSCEKCSSVHLKSVGSGTERIEEDLKQSFPLARIARMDQDSTQRRGSVEKIFERVQKKEIDILVGTQMIVKGHDFEEVTLVGILVADASLYLPDFRASEDSFQKILQVSGRAGRGKKPGRVLLQCLNPFHPSLIHAANHDLTSFYDEEMMQRESLFYPPFSRLVLFRLEGQNLEKVLKEIDLIKSNLERLQTKHHIQAEILGPAPCLIEKVNNLYRWQILWKLPPKLLPQSLIRQQILASHLKKNGLRLRIEIDPLELF